MPHTEDHEAVRKLLEDNHRLLEENHRLLIKMHRYSFISLCVQLLWYAVLIGFPFALYYYVIGPYFSAFGSNYETFMLGINEIPGLKGIKQVVDATLQK